MSFTEAAYSARKYRPAGVRTTPAESKLILVTGASGSIGSLLVPLLEQIGHGVTATDVDTLDVRSSYQLDNWGRPAPDVVFHLAGAKHAPAAELDPDEAWQVNVLGTANVLAAFPTSKIVLASTCKACNPETVYGASKLIAERMVLNAGGVVARFYNVRETQGNVFRLWESIPEGEPIPWTDCWRYFITAKDAAELLLAAAALPSGRYTVDPGEPSHMLAEARSLYPGRPLVQIARRQGDRYREPLHAAHEQLVPVSGRVVEIVSPHDHPGHVA